MKVQQLLKVIDKYDGQLSQKSRSAFAALCDEHTFTKGTLLLKPSQPDSSEYILLNGTARTFFSEY